MDWRTHYNSRLATPEEAVGHIKSGDRVIVGHACGEPGALLDAMAANAAAYRHVEIVHMVSMGTSPYCAEGMEEHFTHNSLFAGATTRKAVNEGRGDFTPAFFYKIPELLRTSLRPDVAMVQVSPPDEHGCCSLGVSVDYGKTAVQVATTVIAQVNRNMPRTLGESMVHATDLDVIVELDTPVIELPKAAPGEVEMRIGENCAGLIQDGDTLQLGIGAIPDAVLHFLGGKKDLGIHSEMFSDGVVELIEAGVVTNAKKKVHPGLCVASFLMGTRRLYDFVDDNPLVYLAGVEWVNHPLVISQNDNVVAINSCVQVDLQGQVVSSSAGLRQISGIGGQADFVRGASYSKGGRSIMAFPSLAKGGVSKIVAFADAGSAVSQTREDVDYVVTEHGVAALAGQTLRERARRLIAVAHPDVREGLQEEYERRFGSLDAILGR
ncbi:MAG: hypothetical protein LBR32_10695 [Propionibacteriaceae bacterium]|jgi:4-hydroxybutyrate CoA-transferase|nr:hypothetical protein [Propionibacteriaceae bacterium]